MFEKVPTRFRSLPQWAGSKRRLLLASLVGCLALMLPGPVAMELSADSWADGSNSGSGGGGSRNGERGDSKGGEGGNSTNSKGSDSDGGEGGDSDGGDGGDSDSGDGGDSDGGEGGDGDSGSDNSGSGGSGGGDSDGGDGGDSDSSEGGDGNDSSGRSRSGTNDDGDVNENGTDDEAERALDLRESGKIKPLGQVFAIAERKFLAKVIGSALIETPGLGSGWRYDLRVRTGDGKVQEVSYDAGSGALVEIDGLPAE